MTVSSTTNREQYATDGVTAAFTIHFPFFDDTDVNAVLVAGDGAVTTLSLNADFTVTGGGGAGGMLACNVAPADGGTLTLYREIPFTQEDDYVEDDPLPADTLEGGFDRAVMRDQQLKDGQDRALTLPVTVQAGVSGNVPLPQAGRFLAWNAEADALENKTVVTGDSVVFTSLSALNAGMAAGEAIDPATLAGSRFNPTGKHLIPVLAASMQPATTNGAAAGAVETGSNKVLYRTLDFDQTTQEFAGFVLPWPKSADESTISFRARWTAIGGTVGYNVAVALEAIGFGDDDALDTSYGTAVQVNDALLATGDLHVTAESAAVTIKNLAEGDLVAFRVKRVVSGVSNNLASDLRLIGIDLFLTTDKGNDA